MRLVPLNIEHLSIAIVGFILLVIDLLRRKLDDCVTAINVHLMSSK